MDETPAGRAGLGRSGKGWADEGGQVEIALAGGDVTEGVLSYVNGEVAGRPRPPWIADETRLASVGQLVRDYDDAAAWAM